MIPRMMGHDSRIVRVFPELRQIADPAERARLYWQAYRVVRWRTLLIYLLFLVPGFAAWALGLDYYAGWLGSNAASSAVVIGLTSLPVALISLFLARWICARRFQRAIRLTLLAHGYQVCIRCGYDLKGQTAPRCPECGTAFDSPLLEHETTGASHD
jgi:hypothetical protein